MTKKPVSPTLHGIIDYVFSGIQLAVPSVIGLNAPAIKTYATLGSGFLAMNAISDTPVAIKPIISFKMLLFSPRYRFLRSQTLSGKTKKRLAFTLVFFLSQLPIIS